MLSAAITQMSTAVHAVVVAASGRVFPAAEPLDPSIPEPNPITDGILKEAPWAAGSFFVLLILMRYVLFPRLKKGMDDRYEGIRSNHDMAEKVKADARGDVAEYERALADARAEAAARLDKARQTVDAERTARLAEVNARIAAARAEADAKTAEARAAAMSQIESAVGQVTARATELATGRPADPSTVQAAVAAAMESAGAR
jgi:F-type H+-transporting ATPase subunit b